MKIMVMAAMLPEVKNLVTSTYNSFFTSLKNRTECEEVWVMSKPDRFKSKAQDGRLLADLHSFRDAVDLLEDIRPDCILANSFDFVSISLIVAARHTEVPVFMVSEHSLGFGKQWEPLKINRLKKMFRLFFSDKVPNDEAEDKSSMRRGRFIAYKMRFLYHTLRRTGTGPLGAIATVVRELALAVLYQDSHYSRLPNYYFMPDGSFEQELIRGGTDAGSIFIIGSLVLENVEVRRDPELGGIGTSDRADVLVVTDAMYEHGYWSYGQRAGFVTSVVSRLKRDPGIRITFKIHPSSENVQEYRDMLAGFGDIPILQSEELSEIIPGFDAVISYGYSTAHSEIVAGGKRMVMVDTPPHIAYPALVEEAARSGIVVFCDSPSEAAGAVRELLQKDAALSDEFVAKRDALIPEVRPSERMAEIVADVLRARGSQEPRA